MRFRRAGWRAGALTIAVTTIVGSGLAGGAAGVAAVATVAPHPFLQDHITAKTLSFPPSTSYCLAHFGIHCYQPAQFQKAYNLAPLFAAGITGRGRTIAIVDSFGSPTIQHDLQVFDRTFGLKDPPTLTVIQPAGVVAPFDATNGDRVGWAEETTLDVEWSHVMAPDANILLVETPVSETEGVQGFPEIVTAENYVINHHLADVISQSFGATEETFPSAQSILDLRSAFINAQKHHVTVLAASGDAGATDYQSNASDLYTHRVNSWPSADPLVTSVGGTMLNLDASGNRITPDVVWNDGYGAGGGGLSSVFSRPQFQNSVASVVGAARGTPDISLSAAVDGAVVYYWSFVPGRVGFHLVGGTSEATPLFAGVVVLADQAAGRSLGDLNPWLYRDRTAEGPGLVDVTSGNNSFGPFTNSDGNTYTVTGFEAGPGYDLASGLGTPDVAAFVGQLRKTDQD